MGRLEFAACSRGRPTATAVRPSGSSPRPRRSTVYRWGIGEPRPISSEADMPRLKVEESSLLGTCGAADYLGVGRSTLDLWRRKGEITPTVVAEGPNRPLYKFDKVDLDKFREKIDYDC